MKNIREFGIVFLRQFDAGIAKVTVFNSTDGLYVSESGNEITNYSFRLVDLYIPSTSAYQTEEKTIVYHIPLTVGKNYTITVEHSGTHNALATSPYYVHVLRFLNYEPFVDGTLTGILRVWSKTFPSDIYDFTLTKNTEVNFEKTSTFNGDGTTRIFRIVGTNHAYIPVRFSNDGGATWLYPYSTSLTWGQNVNCNDNLVDVNNQFGVNFNLAPSIGVGNVLIVWRPLIDTWKILGTLNQPASSDGTFIDIKSNVDQMDYAVEFSV